MDTSITTDLEETIAEETIAEETSPTESKTEAVQDVLSSKALAMERRRHSRRDYRTTVNITVFLAEDGAFNKPDGPILSLVATSRNISQGGMCFSCPQHLEMSRLVIQFRLPEQSYTVVEAEVVHSYQDNEGQWVYGVAFRRLLPSGWPRTDDQAAREDSPSAPSA